MDQQYCTYLHVFVFRLVEARLGVLLDLLRYNASNPLMESRLDQLWSALLLAAVVWLTAKEQA